MSRNLPATTRKVKFPQTKNPAGIVNSLITSRAGELPPPGDWGRGKSIRKPLPEALKFGTFMGEEQSELGKLG
jgi:hypothetical protein